MRESQAEIKAIEAQLRSIRVESSSSQRTSTLLEPPSPHSKPGNTTVPYPAAHRRQGQTPSADRRHDDRPTQTHPHHTGRVESYPLPPKYRLPNHLEATIDRLQEQSAFYVQQFRQVQSQAFQTPEQLLEQNLKVLESQVQHINQLSSVQESAILELKTMAEQVEREWKTIEHSQGIYATAEVETPPICEYLGASVPQIQQNRDGIYVLSARPIDLFKAEREATHTAAALRHWANRNQPPQVQSQPSSFWQRLGNLLSSSDNRGDESPAPATTATAVSGHASQSSRRVVRSRQRRSASASVLRLKELVALFLGAVIVRVALDLVLVSFPVLWTPAVALLVTPAAIAVYRSSHTPQSGLVWGYRLLVIMLGLLLGGRL